MPPPVWSPKVIFLVSQNVSLQTGAIFQYNKTGLIPGSDSPKKVASNLQ